MHNNNAIKENQARQRLLGFSLFTLGGAGLEGGFLHRGEEDASRRAAQHDRPLTQSRG